MSVSVFYRFFLLFGNQLGEVEETVFPYNVSKLVHVVKTENWFTKACSSP